MSAPDVDLERRRRLVTRFLQRCRAWGVEREIPRTLDRLREEAVPAHAARLHQWTTWVAFLDHALGELDRGDLDAWLADPDEALSAEDPAVAGPETAG